MLARWVRWLPPGLFVALLALAFLVGNLDFVWNQWVGIALGLGFLASLVLMAWVNITGLVIREWRKGHKAALVYGPLAMIIVAAFVAWWVYVIMYVAQ